MGVDERFKAKKRERNQILKQKSQRKKNKKGVQKKKLINTHVKVILVPLLKNMYYQKLIDKYILMLSSRSTS